MRRGSRSRAERRHDECDVDVSPRASADPECPSGGFPDDRAAPRQHDSLTRVLPRRPTPVADRHLDALRARAAPAGWYGRSRRPSARRTQRDAPRSRAPARGRLPSCRRAPVSTRARRDRAQSSILHSDVKTGRRGGRLRRRYVRLATSRPRRPRRQQTQSACELPPLRGNGTLSRYGSTTQTSSQVATNQQDPGMELPGSIGKEEEMTEAASAAASTRRAVGGGSFDRHGADRADGSADGGDHGRRHRERADHVENGTRLNAVGRLCARSIPAASIDGVNGASVVEMGRPVDRIRDAVPGEALTLEALHRRSSDVWDEDRAHLAAHPDAIEPPHQAIAEGRVRVAVDDKGRALGFSVVLQVEDGACELDDLFVEPDSMRLGVGRLLVEDVAARAATEGARRVMVTANPRALGFYERLGFRITGEAPTRFAPAPRMTLDLFPA